MIPQKIRSYFITTYQANDNAKNMIEGILNCCNTHEFEVYVIGEIRRNIFSKMYLSSNNEITLVEARCKKCRKVISVFDSSCDGYEKGNASHSSLIKSIPVSCKKCRNKYFSIIIKYEYPDIQELDELGITEIDNSFTWIWITLKCDNCGITYKNFVSFETS